MVKKISYNFTYLCLWCTNKAVLEISTKPHWLLCERCIVEGSYELGRVVIDDINIPLRDDDSFEQALYLDTQQIQHGILGSRY